MRHRLPTFGPATRRPHTARPGNTTVPRALRFTPDVTEILPPHPLGRDAALARLEAALFLADEPLPARKLADAAGLPDGHAARRLIERLRTLYADDNSSFQIEELGGGYQLLTRSAYHPWLLRLRRTGQDVRLTPAVLETLAVIAYKQPITRADVDNLRGVSCAELIRLLMEKGLVRVTGRHDSLGRPQLYGTTKRFLQAFGMNTLADLPEVESLKRPNS
jgi:segregation and condensation protein B